MALPSYLELVNKVLVRLREPTVGTVDEHVLSRLVGVFVNDAKRAVEDAYNWNALTETLTATTTAGVFNYVLDGSGARFKVIEVYNNSQRFHMAAKTSREMTSLFISNPVPDSGVPSYYNFNGIDSNGDTQVDIYPVPDDVYTLYFNLYVPQAELENDEDTLSVPAQPVVQLAYAMGLVERGEDGGMSNSEAYSVYKSILSDYIAIEASRYPEEETWEAT
jgi:hypothetical protein